MACSHSLEKTEGRFSKITSLPSCELRLEVQEFTDIKENKTVTAMKTQQNNRFDEQKSITSLKCWVWKLKPRRKITLFSTSSPTLDLYDLETGRSEAKWRTTNRAIRELWFLGKMSLVKFTLASPLSPVLLSWNLILYLINIYINKFHVDQEHSTGVDVLLLRI